MREVRRRGPLPYLRRCAARIAASPNRFRLAPRRFSFAVQVGDG